MRRGLNGHANPEGYLASERNRALDKGGLLAALKEQGIQPIHPASAQEPYTPALCHALHLYLARSNTALQALQLDDVLGMPDPVNVPGTNREYPNWQLKLPDELEELEKRADLTAAFSNIDRVRAELTR